ncbi:Protein of unknown function (DUF2454) [Geosmithia morbida]|uniref:Uncharacterized protein n=1 Tax=Geosmithia morbida TaxID=1094350 RepID=A0A9P4Z134_9HYPO|nr:Protein of unknown function (DUF2454) [Geosmithia morbida]KAF4125338.1 Protein of unknown function (DUF2454) [Geosmithia morbida]
MSTFLDKCPAKVLKSTGIGKVFQDAIFPSVLFLPSLTPEAESIQIMQPAYRALIILAEKDPDTSSPTRRLLLDSIIREGILTAYDHASSYIHVVETLLRTLATVVNCLGVYTVKHLQTLLPTISTVMTDPFVVSHPPALLEATKALQAILANCWPRICQGGYADEVTRIIATCWLNIQDDEVDSLVLPGLLGELKKLASMLRSIQHAQGDKTVPRVEEILKAEPKLRELFSTTQAGAT